MTPTVRRCPACGTTTATVVHIVSLIPPDGHPLAGGYPVVVCTRCGTGFANVVPPLAWYEDHYRSTAKYQTETIDSVRRHAALTAADRIAELIPARSIVVDIGAGAGALVVELRNRGFDATAEGPRAAGLVSMMGVLEHVWDTDDFLDRVLTMIGVEGYAYVEVPDAENYLDPFVAPFEDFNTEHVNHFTAHSLCLLMARHGMAVHKLEHEQVEVSPSQSAAIIRASFGSAAAPSVRALSDYSLRSGADLWDVNVYLEQRLKPFDHFTMWGAGEAAYRLLALPALANRRLDLIVDGNSARRRLSIKGHRVLDPSALKWADGPIVVASFVQASSILQEAERLELLSRVLVVQL